MIRDLMNNINFNIARSVNVYFEFDKFVGIYIDHIEINCFKLLIKKK